MTVARARRLARWMESTFGGLRLLVVTHGGVANELVQAFAPQAPDVDFGPGAISHLVAGDTGYIVQELAQVHLPPDLVRTEPRFDVELGRHVFDPPEPS